MAAVAARAGQVLVVGALAGLSVFWIAFARQQGVAWDADRDLPLTAGFSRAERAGAETFAWTSASASFELAGARRSVPWVCDVRLRGGRPPGVPQPLVQLGADGLVSATVTATNDYQDVRVPIAARPGRTGLRLTIAASPVMVPGPADPRPLGVQVDRLACRPDATAFLVPPGAALAAAAAVPGAFGAATVVLGLPLPAALVAAGTLAVGQAWPLAVQAGPYSSFPATLVRLGGVLSLVLVVVGLATRLGGRPLSTPAACAIAFVAAAFVLEVSALLHPAKPIVDAQFQAHRLEWVLAGRWFFTQPMPDGVRFPYAIGLYLVAAPWTLVTSDHVALVRIVASAARALAALALYALVRSAGGSRPEAAASTMGVYLVPLPYLNVGNANLTFVFAQAVATMTLAAAVVIGPRGRGLAGGLALSAVAGLAFLSHVGVFPVLLTTLIVLAGLYWWSAGGNRRAAAVVAAAALAAAIFSVVAYYGRFAEAYQSLDRVISRATSMVSGPAAESSEAQPPAAPAGLTLPQRALNAVRIVVRAIGWPLLLLAVAGAWRAWRDRSRDRALLAAAATIAGGAVFLVSAVAAPVEPRFQRYTDEFLDRVSYMSLPAAVLLAARGLGWAWQAGRLARAAAVVVLVAAVWGAVEAWMAWLR